MLSRGSSAAAAKQANIDKQFFAKKKSRLLFDGSESLPSRRRKKGFKFSAFFVRRQQQSLDGIAKRLCSVSIQKKIHSNLSSVSVNCFSNDELEFVSKNYFHSAHDKSHGSFHILLSLLLRWRMSRKFAEWNL